MFFSLRISAYKEKLIQSAVKKSGKSITDFINEAIDEKLGLGKNREQLIREMAGYLSHEEAEELREAINQFNEINEGDWL
jgi:uncharacterized protein (DUF1778 family)